MIDIIITSILKISPILLLILIIISIISNIYDKKRERELEEIRKHILSLTDVKDYGICNPPMKPEVALDELFRYFLGEDYYCVLPQSYEQCITDLVYQVESNYKGYGGK